MVDTVRTLSALQTLLADNTSQAISPQDIRDFLVSVQNGHGAYYFSTPSATTISTPGTYVKAAGTTTEVGSAVNWTHVASNRIRYDGTPTRYALCTVTCSFTTAGSNDNISIRIAKNGTTDVTSQITRKVGTGTDEGAAGTQLLVSMATNDYLELWVTNDDAAANVTIQHGQITVFDLLD